MERSVSPTLGNAFPVRLGAAALQTGGNALRCDADINASGADQPSHLLTSCLSTCLNFSSICAAYLMVDIPGAYGCSSAQPLVHSHWQHVALCMHTKCDRRSPKKTSTHQKVLELG
jgi:hypothetical protein